MDINWFPGHMAKAQRMIVKDIHLVDVIVELLDARIPASSSNPMISDMIQSKPKVIALNKSDMAETEITQKWLKFYRQQGQLVVAFDAISGRGIKDLVNQIEVAARPKIQAAQATGIRNRPIRVMILGIPNVGKSSLINRLKGSATVRTADKPGVTRGKQWIKIGKNLELLDTPGVLWPKLDSAEVAFKLAVTGAINDDVYDVEKVVLTLLTLLRDNYHERLTVRYGLESPIPEDSEELLKKIALKRGCLRAGGIIDSEKTIRIVLSDFRLGKLGRFSLDIPEQDSLV